MFQVQKSVRVLRGTTTTGQHSLRQSTSLVRNFLGGEAFELILPCLRRVVGVTPADSAITVLCAHVLPSSNKSSQVEARDSCPLPCLISAKGLDTITQAQQEREPSGIQRRSPEDPPVGASSTLGQGLGGLLGPPYSLPWLACSSGLSFFVLFRRR